MKKLITTPLLSFILLMPSIPLYASLAPVDIECELGEEDSLLSEEIETDSDITTLFTDLIDGILSSFNLAKVVDIYQVFTNIMGGELPEEVALSNASENNLPQSYAHRKDFAETMTRTGAIATVQDTTLGPEAQEKTRENCLFANDATELIFDLGEESQSLDTSQQILQNISGQLGQQSTVELIAKEELTLIRQDLGLSTILEAQIAEELHQSNLSQRRAKIATQNLTILQNGLVILPGGLWEEAE
jgi:hypothetical protein